MGQIERKVFAHAIFLARGVIQQRKIQMRISERRRDSSGMLKVFNRRAAIPQSLEGAAQIVVSERVVRLNVESCLKTASRFGALTDMEKSRAQI